MISSKKFTRLLSADEAEVEKNYWKYVRKGGALQYLRACFFALLNLFSHYFLTNWKNKQKYLKLWKNML